MQELLYQVTQQDIGYIEVGLVGHVNFKADNTLAIKAKDTRDTTSPRSPDSLTEEARQFKDAFAQGQGSRAIGASRGSLL